MQIRKRLPQFFGIGKGLMVAMVMAAMPCFVQAQQQDTDPLNDEFVLDSMEAFSEDTTFFYEGDDTTEVIMSEQDFNDLIEEWTSDGGFLPQWLRGWLGGGLGMLGALLVFAVALFVLILLLVIFTAPIWVVVLILWLLLRKSGKKDHSTTKTYKAPPSETETPSQSSTDHYNKSEN